MVFQASLNPNGDLLVVVDETVCVGVPVEVMSSVKGKEDSYDKDWYENLLIPRLEASEWPRTEQSVGPIEGADLTALKNAVKKAFS